MNRVSKLRIGYSLIVLLLCLIVANCNRIIEQRKQYYYDRGMKLFNSGDYNKAVQEFGKALQFDERYFDALYMQGMSNYSSGDYAAAIGPFKKALAERQEDINLKLKLAECFIKAMGVRGKGVQQRTYFADVISPLAEKNRDARILLLRFYLVLNKLIEAENIIEGFLRDGEKSSDFYAVLVQFKVKKNKVSEAEDIALKSFSHTPDWMKAMKLLIDQLKDSENYTSLEKIYKKIIEQVPNKLPYQQDLANIYRKQGNSEMENMLFQEMLKSNPDNLQVKSDYVNFLIRYNKKGDFIM